MVHFRFPIHQLPPALQGFASDMETIVDQVLNNKSECKPEGCESGQGCTSTYTPALDIVETEASYSLLLDLPGVKIDAVQLEMQEDRLLVSGTRAGSTNAENVQVHRQERTVGAFSRSIRLPKLLDLEKIEANFDNGVLQITLPKQAKSLPRTIPIKAGS
jgi:HSP20 family protein